jgi:CheY-like chemotaxis protein
MKRISSGRHKKGRLAHCTILSASENEGIVDEEIARLWLDIGLPMMDGNEVARHIRSKPELASIALVAVTGHGQEQDRRRTAASGFDAHLMKPVDIQQVCELILTLAETSRPGASPAP